MPIGQAINEVLNLGGEHNLFRRTGDFYQILTKFPGILFDSNGYIKFETKAEYEDNSQLRLTTRTHITDGIKSLPNYKPFNEEELFVVNQIVDDENIDPDTIDINNQAERRPRNIDTIVRNQTLVRKVKKIRDNTCQICQNKLQIGPNSYYSEVHHLRPLGNPHKGLDKMENMLCVCPNCHKKLDYGFEPIVVNIKDLDDHKINQRYIDYHNNRVN